jgi:uncharacterized damage-inducible protein DinB
VIDLIELRAVLTRTPAVLRAMLGVLPDDALAFHEAAGAWNAREVLCHLADGEVHDWIPRIAIVMGDAGGRFVPFDREAGMVRYRDWSVAQLLDEFDRVRTVSLTRLDAFAIAPADLAREAIHPDLGSVTLEQLLACWVTHDYAHLAQISRVMVRWFGRSVGPWTAYFSLLR